MTPISAYQQQDNFLRLLLQGPPGSRKTSLACYFPKPYIVDMDKNLWGVISYHTKHNLPIPVGYDHVDRKADGTPIGNLIGAVGAEAVQRQLAPRYERLNELLIAAQTNPAIDTIVLDSGTILAELLLAYTAVKQGFPKDGRQLFGFFLQNGKQLINTLMQMRKHTVLIVHEKIDQDPMNGGTLQYRVAWPGQLADFMGAYFTNVWRSEIKREGFGSTAKYSQILRTMQDSQFYGLKNNMDLPAEFAFDWAKIQARLGLPTT